MTGRTFWIIWVVIVILIALSACSHTCMDNPNNMQCMSAHEIEQRLAGKV